MANDPRDRSADRCSDGIIFIMQCRFQYWQDLCPSDLPEGSSCGDTRSWNGIFQQPGKELDRRLRIGAMRPARRFPCCRTRSRVVVLRQLVQCFGD